MSEEESDYTIGEFEEMDLSELYNKTFLVAVNTGLMHEGEFVCTSLCGPYDFYEMVGIVGEIYETQQLHAKCLITHERFGVPPTVLNENTVDFIEARYMDIVADGLLDGGIFKDKEYTCKAGFIPVVVDEPEEEVNGEEDDEDV